MKKCPFCAENIQDEAIKCRHCYEFLGEAHLRADAAGRREAVRVAGPIARVVLIGLFVALAYFGVRSMLSPDFPRSLRFLFSLEFWKALKDLLAPPSHIISRFAYFYLLFFLLAVLIRVLRLYIRPEGENIPEKTGSAWGRHSLLRKTFSAGASVMAVAAFFVLVLLAAFRHWDERGKAAQGKEEASHVFGGNGNFDSQQDLLEVKGRDRNGF